MSDNLPGNVSPPDRPSTLSEECRERIRLEEAYRREVRDWSSKGEVKSRRLEFLNSPFGLWIVSGLLFTAVVSVAEYWSHIREEAAASNQLARELRADFLHQLQILEFTIEDADTDNTLFKHGRTRIVQNADSGPPLLVIFDDLAIELGAEKAAIVAELRDELLMLAAKMNDAFRDNDKSRWKESLTKCNSRIVELRKRVGELFR